jgi:hypothetical protein
MVRSERARPIVSVNFYNSVGQMLGVDCHTYWFVGGPPQTAFFVGLPMPFAPHVVCIPFFGTWPATFYKDTDTVSSDGWDMLQDGYDWYLIPHIPAVPMPMSVLGCVILGKTIVDSGSKPFMSVHSVTGEGEPLATSVFGWFGLNANCWDGGLSLPTGIVYQPNSVVTTPTLGDYIGAVAGLLGDNLVGVLTDPIDSSIIKHVLRRLPDVLKKLGIDSPEINSIVDFPGEVKKAVQRAVDDL